jgi:Trk-type K+ transport system membrane component
MDHKIYLRIYIHANVNHINFTVTFTTIVTFTWYLLLYLLHQANLTWIYAVFTA